MVSIFLFIGGYGIYKLYREDVTYNKILKKIFKLYLSYWSVFIIFVPIGILIGKLDLNFKELFFNFIGLSSSVNKEWWFFIDYIILIMLYPIIVKFIFRYNKYRVLICSFIIFCIGSVGNIIFYRMNTTKFELIFNVMNLQFMFISGIVVSKYAIFDKVSEFVNKTYKYIVLLILSSIMLFVFPVKTFIYAIITPIIIFSLTNSIKKSIVLEFLGRNSTNIWFTHTFFCYYYFQELIFAPKYSILIIIWIISLILITSIIIDKLKIFVRYVYNIDKYFNLNSYNFKK